MLRLAVALCFAVGTPAAFSQSSSPAHPKGFDVNDVTVLFPLDPNDQPVPSFTLNDALISSRVFSTLLIEATNQWISAPEGASIMKRDDWKIVGFRYDPCAPGDEEKSRTCHQELRLVAQSFGRFGPADSSLHLVYRLKEGFPSEKEKVLHDLLSLKENRDSRLATKTDGEPLGIHPILARAAAEGHAEIIRRFELFVETYARADTLQKVTMMGLRDGSPIDWIFLGGVVEGGQWVSTTVPNLANGLQSVVELNLGGGADVFLPNTLDTRISMETFFNNNTAGVRENLRDIDEASHRLENPMLTDRTTTDCVSCHAATSVRLTRNFPFQASIENLSAKVPSRITAFPAPGMLTSHPSHWNLRALGYFGLQPSFTMRTVNESARVAAQLNTLLKLEAPGPDCSDVITEVMACFVDSSRLFGTMLPKETCLKSCRK